MHRTLRSHGMKIFQLFYFTYRWYLIVHNHNAALPLTTFVEKRSSRICPRHSKNGTARMRVMRVNVQCGDRFSNVHQWILLSIAWRMNKPLVLFKNKIERLLQVASFTLLHLLSVILEENIWPRWLFLHTFSFTNFQLETLTSHFQIVLRSNYAFATVYFTVYHCNI